MINAMRKVWLQRKIYKSFDILSASGDNAGHV